LNKVSLDGGGQIPWPLDEVFFKSFSKSCLRREAFKIIPAKLSK